MNPDLILMFVASLQNSDHQTFSVVPCILFPFLALHFLLTVHEFRMNGLEWFFAERLNAAPVIQLTLAQMKQAYVQTLLTPRFPLIEHVTPHLVVKAVLFVASLHQQQHYPRFFGVVNSLSNPFNAC